MRYWDASALVPTLVAQAATTRMHAIAAEDPAITTCWNTPVECVSAVARLEREARITAAEYIATLARLRAEASAWNVVVPNDATREQAFRLVRVHALRAGDAIQLGSALVATNFQPATLDFVTLDTRLAEAADKEGFRVVT